MTDLTVTVPAHSWRRLGATPDEGGTAFALWAPRASEVELCLVDHGPGGGLVETRVTLPEITHGTHHGHVAGVRPGQRYGFRVHGPWDPGNGHRCDPGKLLLDPYARALEGELRYGPAVVADGPYGSDSLGSVPLSVVVAPPDRDGHDGTGERPMTALPDSVIYELHVRHFTMQHPDVPPELRGTYAGLAHPAVVEHLRRLGVTAVELLPVHHFVSERALAETGRQNAWGYNPVGFFAPHAAYSAAVRAGERGGQVREFRELVRTLHEAGIEVVLDVVYNHTGESDLTGPTLAFRGIDNAAYYRLDGTGAYEDVTGCGNTLDLREPQVVRLVMDSLRYWVEEMGVDGFRFDLAPALARGDHGVDLRGPFFTAVAQDPVLRDVKLIAEPWDLGPGGYQVGRFPPTWAEWNDKFRETVRSFWLAAPGAGHGVRDLAYRLSGSSDLYRDDGRRPYASINYVVSHDGRTLADLVASAGFADEHAQRRARALLATTLLATGVPMLLAGDELGRTQGGEANAYTEDSPVSWLAWPGGDGRSPATATRDLVAGVVALRAAHPALRHRHFFEGRPRPASPADAAEKDLTWLAPSGLEMTHADWESAERVTLGALVSGAGLHDDTGRPAADVLVWLHAGTADAEVALPPDPRGRAWACVLHTSADEPLDDRAVHRPGDLVALPASSVVVLVRR